MLFSLFPDSDFLLEVPYQKLEILLDCCYRVSRAAKKKGKKSIPSCCVEVVTQHQTSTWRPISSLRVYEFRFLCLRVYDLVKCSGLPVEIIAMHKRKEHHLTICMSKKPCSRSRRSVMSGRSSGASAQQSVMML